MKCPVCKTECYDRQTCPECGFTDLRPTFINKSDADNWLEEQIKPYRRKYWSRYNQFEIQDETIIKYLGKDTNVKIPYGIVAIGKDAFQMSPVESISFPNTVTRIEEGALSWCLSLSGVVILPDCLEYIGPNAFMNSHSVKKISLPSGVQNIEHNALRNSKYWQAIVEFRGEPNNYCINNGFLVHRKSNTLVEFLGNHNPTMILGSPNSLDLSTVLSCVSRIGRYVLPSIRPMLEDLVLPNNIKFIDEEAFCCCLSLQWVVLPKSITYLGKNSFTLCNADIFCETESLPETWDKECFEDGFTKAEKHVFWGGTWHYEKGRPVPNE